MEIIVIARQALLYGHIIAFALALATILKEDVRLLRAQRIDSASLHASGKLVQWLLLALWVTGVPMVMMDIGTDVSLLLGKPKLLAKLIVVGALTLNGILLHLVAFPMITGKPKNPNRAATIAAMLGAVSITSWLYASFLGAARLVAPYFSLNDYVILYLLLLAAAVPFAILVVRSRLKLLLTGISDGQGYSLSAALLEAEIARLALSDIQRRLRTKHAAQQFSAPDTSPVPARKRTHAALGGLIGGQYEARARGPTNSAACKANLPRAQTRCVGAAESAAATNFAMRRSGNAVDPYSNKSAHNTAGLPTARQLAGMSLVTTLPTPTTEWCPTKTPERIITRDPIHT